MSYANDKLLFCKEFSNIKIVVDGFFSTEGIMTFKWAKVMKSPNILS